MELYFEITAKPPRIIDGKGNPVTVAQAKAFVDAGKVTNCNVAFQRLTQYDFDIEATVRSFDQKTPWN